MPASRTAVYASAVAAVLFGVSSVAAKDCAAACTLFENTNQKYLVHESKVKMHPSMTHYTASFLAIIFPRVRS